VLVIVTRHVSVNVLSMRCWSLIEREVKLQLETLGTFTQRELILVFEIPWYNQTLQFITNFFQHLTC